MTPAELKKAPAPASDASFTPEEFQTLLKLAKRAIRADARTRRALQDQKVNIVPHNFYSEIPGVADIEDSFEFKVPDGPYNSPRVFDPGRIKAFLGTLSQYAAEFDPPADGDIADPKGYFWNNPAFAYSDAMAYYCVLRHVKPKRILEVGSGFSTLVALQAVEKNGVGHVSCIEPFPMPWLAKMTDKITLYQEPVQGLQAGFFNERLATGDVFFIDSTHTVKAGSDCLHLYLRILPELKSDLMVHAHDIYLPFPLQRNQFDRHVFWTEQYLLYAYLLDNPKAQVVYGSYYNFKFNKDALTEFMHGRYKPGGASIWFTLKGSASLPKV